MLNARPCMDEFSRRASRVSIKICDGKYRNNESARQQINVSKSMCAPAIFALFPHVSPLFFTTNTHCFGPRRSLASVKMNFHDVFPVCKRSNRDKVKFRSLVDRFYKFGSSHSRIIIGSTQRELSIEHPASLLSLISIDDIYLNDTFYQ